MTTCSGSKSILLLICCFSTLFAFAANTITGKVLNQTTGRPSAGDEVVLLRLGEGMQEESRTRTDQRGAFSFALSEPDAHRIVRVFHQGVNYDQSVSGVAPLEIGVFDAVSRSRNVKGKIGMVQVQPEERSLKVAQMYAISNASVPPVTQSSPHNFEVFLPARASLDSFQVKRSGGVWVNVAPVPVKGKAGHYAVDFPLRPGDTLFKFSYHLPYDGRAAFHMKLPYPVARFAVLHPPSMRFQAARPGAFASPGLVRGLRLEQATGTMVSEAPEFEISGPGTAPERNTEARTPSAVGPSGGADLPDGGERAAPDFVPAAARYDDRPGEEIWALVSAALALLAAGIFAVWRKRSAAAQAFAEAVTAAGQSSVEILKEELFELESERLRGSISPEQYAANKQALNLSIERAAARNES